MWSHKGKFFNDMDLCRMMSLICRRERYYKNSVILTVTYLTHMWYHGIRLWNDDAVDWLSLKVQFGRFVFVAQNIGTWFSAPTACSSTM